MRAAVIWLVALSLFWALSGQPAAAQSSRTETIAAVVNEDAVSVSDLEERLRLVMASSGMPDNADTRQRMMPQILNVLVEEKLKLQEAARMEIEISPQDIEEGFATIAGQNNLSADQFRQMLRREGVSPHSLEDQIRSQIAWSRVVQMKLRPDVVIADNEVDAVLERLEASLGKDEFRVSEIFLPVEMPSQEADVMKLADKLTRQIVEGKAPFPRLAQQFSQAAGASKGGDLGWVQQGQLAEPLEEMLVRMNEGEVSSPVRTLAGFHILYLRGKRSISAETLPSRDDIMQRLGLERLDRLQKSYLMDLKAQAFIEQRV